jgi:hypothetical protein
MASEDFEKLIIGSDAHELDRFPVNFVNVQSCAFGTGDSGENTFLFQPNH